MFAQLTSGLDLHANALVLRAQRQHAIASNIANADTPGYVAQDINFKQAMAAAQGHTSLTLRPPVSAAGQTAHAAHLPLRAGNPASELASAGRAYTVQTQPSMDNNTVDLDRERANFVDNAVRYESTLRFINGYSRTILSAISGQ
jgi:flagellar basal-body rod protein FlgB